MKSRAQGYVNGSDIAGKAKVHPLPTEAPAETLGQSFVRYHFKNASAAWAIVRDWPDYEQRLLAAMILLERGNKPTIIADICQLNSVAVDAVGKHVVDNPPNRKAVRS